MLAIGRAGDDVARLGPATSSSGGTRARARTRSRAGAAVTRSASSAPPTRSGSTSVRWAATSA
jgi:hypothetical protein